jgi:16S rRNA (guanine527-N7)-methyltransferase
VGEAETYTALLERLALPPQAIRPLAAYLDRLDAWAERVNLTGARTPADRVDLLVRDVAPLAGELLPGGLLDVGSGNGSPGLVLAALRPELSATLLEPRQRRWAFLREATRAMGRPDITVHRLRHDQYAGRPETNVVVRALALPLVELAALVAPQGQLLILGRPPAGEAPGLGRPRTLPGGAWAYSRVGRST